MHGEKYDGKVFGPFYVFKSKKIPLEDEVVNEKINTGNHLQLAAKKNFLVFITKNSICLLPMIDSFIPNDIDKSNTYLYKFRSQIFKVVSFDDISVLYQIGKTSFIEKIKIKQLMHGGVKENCLQIEDEIIDFDYTGEDENEILLLNSKKILLLYKDGQITKKHQPELCDLFQVYKKLNFYISLNFSKQNSVSFYRVNDFSYQTQMPKDASLNSFTEKNLEILKISQMQNYLVLIASEGTEFFLMVGEIDVGTLSLKGILKSEIEKIPSKDPKNVLLIINETDKMIFLIQKGRILVEWFKIEDTISKSLLKLCAIPLFDNIIGATMNDNEYGKKIYPFSLLVFDSHGEILELQYKKQNYQRLESEKKNPSTVENDDEDEEEKENERIRILGIQTKKTLNEVAKKKQELIQLFKKSQRKNLKLSDSTFERPKVDKEAFLKNASQKLKPEKLEFDIVGLNVLINRYIMSSLKEIKDAMENLENAEQTKISFEETIFTDIEVKQILTENRFFDKTGFIAKTIPLISRLTAKSKSILKTIEMLNSSLLEIKYKNKELDKIIQQQKKTPSILKLLKTKQFGSKSHAISKSSINPSTQEPNRTVLDKLFLGYMIFFEREYFDLKGVLDEVINKKVEQLEQFNELNDSFSSSISSRTNLDLSGISSKKEFKCNGITFGFKSNYLQPNFRKLKRVLRRVFAQTTTARNSPRKENIDELFE